MPPPRRPRPIHVLFIIARSIVALSIIAHGRAAVAVGLRRVSAPDFPADLNQGFEDASHGYTRKLDPRRACVLPPGSQGWATKVEVAFPNSADDAALRRAGAWPGH